MPIYLHILALSNDFNNFDYKNTEFRKYVTIIFQGRSDYCTYFS